MDANKALEILQEVFLSRSKIWRISPKILIRKNITSSQILIFFRSFWGVSLLLAPFLGPLMPSPIRSCCRHPFQSLLKHILNKKLPNTILQCRVAYLLVRAKKCQFPREVGWANVSRLWIWLDWFRHHRYFEVWQVEGYGCFEARDGYGSNKQLCILITCFNSETTGLRQLKNIFSRTVLKVIAFTRLRRIAKLKNFSEVLSGQTCKSHVPSQKYKMDLIKIPI